MKATRPEGERSLAVFIDFENVGLGFGGRRDRFEINKVLERIVEKGKIVAKKAYADWSRFGEYTRSLHEAAIELVEIPRRAQTGKNSADIRLVVDAIDLAYSKDHIDTFVIVSGDSDFSPLVSKLKELGKHVIGLGLADATSVLLRDNCDEFIYYEDLDRAPITPISMNENVPEQKRKVFALLLDSLLALRRENKEVILSSMVKDTMKRKKPSFNEGYYGYRTFSELLEDAQKEGLLELDKHKSSGMYVIVRFGLEMKGPPNGRGSGALPVSEPRRGPVRVEGSENRQPRGRRGPGVGRARPTGPASETPVKPRPEPSHGDDDAYDTDLERPPLGRALLGEIAESAGDEVPSYRPQRAPKPAASPVTPPSKPLVRPTEHARSRKPAGPPPERAPKPAGRRPAAPPKPTVVPAPKPAPKPHDEGSDDFGAGLDV